jgi:hypothetical protein
VNILLVKDKIHVADIVRHGPRNKGMLVEAVD